MKHNLRVSKNSNNKQRYYQNLLYVALKIQDLLKCKMQVKY